MLLAKTSFDSGFAVHLLEAATCINLMPHGYLCNFGSQYKDGRSLKCLHFDLITPHEIWWSGFNLTRGKWYGINYKHHAINCPGARILTF